MVCHNHSFRNSFAQLLFISILSPCVGFNPRELYLWLYNSDQIIGLHRQEILRHQKSIVKLFLENKSSD